MKRIHLLHPRGTPRVAAGLPAPQTASPGTRSTPGPRGCPWSLSSEGPSLGLRVWIQPHSLWASGSVQPVLPGGPASLVGGLFCEGPAG